MNLEQEVEKWIEQSISKPNKIFLVIYHHVLMQEKHGKIKR